MRCYLNNNYDLTILDILHGHDFISDFMYVISILLDSKIINEFRVQVYLRMLKWNLPY